MSTEDGITGMPDMDILQESLLCGLRVRTGIMHWANFNQLEL